MQIHTEIKVDVSAEKAWRVIADQFGEFGQYISLIDSSYSKGEVGVGGSRICHTKNFGPFPPETVEEKIIAFDAEKMQYTYHIVSGVPAILNHAQNTFSIEPIDASSCVVHSHVLAEYKIWLRPISWFFTQMIKRDMKKAFEEIKYFIEHGKAHPRKTKSNIEPVKA